MAKKVATTVYITEAQQSMLKQLHERTKVPIAEYVRQGIDLILQKNRDVLPGQMELGPLPSGLPEERSGSNDEGSNER